MKLRKIMAGVVASALAASTLAVAASATLVTVPAGEFGNAMKESGSGGWVAFIYSKNDEDPTKNVDLGVDVESIKSATVTLKAVEVEEGDYEFFTGGFGGGIVLSSGGGDYADKYGDTIDETYNKKVTDVKNWTGMEYWGTIDKDLEIETIDTGKPVQFQKVADYTYEANVDFPDSVLPTTGAGYVQVAVQEWGSDMCPVEVESVVLKDANGGVVVSYDAKGNATVGGTETPATDAPATDAPATDAPATDAPATDAPTTGDSTKPSTNTGVESVAVVAGVAVLATGAVIVAKKRK